MTIAVSSIRLSIPPLQYEALGAKATEQSKQPIQSISLGTGIDAQVLKKPLVVSATTALLNAQLPTIERVARQVIALAKEKESGAGKAPSLDEPSVFNPALWERHLSVFLQVISAVNEARQSSAKMKGLFVQLSHHASVMQGAATIREGASGMVTAISGAAASFVLMAGSTATNFTGFAKKQADIETTLKPIADAEKTAGRVESAINIRPANMTVAAPKKMFKAKEMKAGIESMEGHVGVLAEQLKDVRLDTKVADKGMRDARKEWRAARGELGIAKHRAKPLTDENSETYKKACAEVTAAEAKLKTAAEKLEHAKAVRMASGKARGTTKKYLDETKKQLEEQNNVARLLAESEKLVSDQQAAATRLSKAQKTARESDATQRVKNNDWDKESAVVTQEIMDLKDKLKTTTNELEEARSKVMAAAQNTQAAAAEAQEALHALQALKAEPGLTLVSSALSTNHLGEFYSDERGSIVDEFSESSRAVFLQLAETNRYRASDLKLVHRANEIVSGKYLTIGSALAAVALLLGTAVASVIRQKEFADRQVQLLRQSDSTLTKSVSENAAQRYDAETAFIASALEALQQVVDSRNSTISAMARA